MYLPVDENNNLIRSKICFADLHLNNQFEEPYDRFKSSRGSAETLDANIALFIAREIFYTSAFPTVKVGVLLALILNHEFY